MKKIIVMLLFAAFMPVFAQNLLDNSSFESIDEQKNIPSSWAVVKRGSFEDTHSFNDKIALDGKNSASIVNNSGITKGVTLLYMQTLKQKINALPVGTEVEFSVFARAVSNTAQVRVYFEAMKAKKLVIRNVNVSADKWTKITMNFTKEDVDYGNPYVCLQLLSGNDVVFDCAYLGEAGKNPYAELGKVDNFISNGGFEVIQNNLPLNWAIINKIPNGKAVAVSDGAASGKNCVKLSAAEKFKGLLMWNQNLDMTHFADIAPETEIEITMKAKTDKPATVFRFYVEFMNNGKYIGTFIAHNQKCSNNSWEEKKFTFKMPKIKPTKANLYLQLMSEGEVMFDDVSMKLKK